MSWQNKTIGCYQELHIDDEMNRKKRNVHIDDDGCSDHMSGLAAAVLGLFIAHLA